MMQYARLEPVWKLLDNASLSGLVSERGRMPAAVQVMQGSAVSPLDAPLIGVAETLLARAREQDGLALAASGYLALEEVSAVFEAVTWEDAEKDIIRAVCRVIHERDFTPLRLARLILEQVGLLYRQKGRLRCRKEGHDIASVRSRIVSSAFWRVDLGEIDGVPLPHWPQDHIGVTLWALSACGSQWSTPKRLMSLTTIADPLMLRDHGDKMLSAFQFRVLRPLVWLGLMEMEEPWDFSARTTRRVRKTPGFDEYFGFDVSLREQSAGSMH